jgi:hypothetical protein
VRESRDSKLVVQIEEITGIDKLTPEHFSHLLEDLKPGGTFDVCAMLHQTSKMGGFVDMREKAILSQVGPGARVRWVTPRDWGANPRTPAAQ